MELVPVSLGKAWGLIMYEIIYSPIVLEKLEMLKTRLVEMCGEKKESQTAEGDR